jgi:sulfur-carrier protein adenylyltransferase/sulfurtransferase
VSVSILIPTPLRRFTGGARTVAVEGTTVGGALAALADGNPELRTQIFDDDGRIRAFVNIFLGDENVRTLAAGSDGVALQDGDVLTLVPAIAGGSVGAPAGEAVELSNDEILRYSRHLIMPEVTLEGQRRLKQARVLCIGAGGLGSPLTLYLAAAGVGTLGVVEFDTVDLSNIQRQVLYATADVGRPKLQAATERLRALNPEIEIVPHDLRLASWNVLDLFRQYDIIADGTDNFPTRYLVNDASVLTGKPNVYASIFRFEGQVSVFGASDGPCYRCLFPEPPPPGLVPSCAEGGVLGVLPGIVGSLQALEVIKLILGIGDPLVGRLAMFDALDFSLREVSIRRDPRCAVCGPNPTVTAPIDYELFCGIRGEEGEVDATGVPILSVDDFDARRRGGETFTLLDVREAYEAEIVQIPGARTFPLSQLPARMHELDSTVTYTLSCHHGTRSVQAYHALRKAGFGRLQVLAGGVDAWAVRIDPTLPRY